MYFDIYQAQALANIICLELALPRVKIIFKPALYDRGTYFENRNTNGSEIEIRKETPRLSTILHEIAHHVQYQYYGYHHGFGETSHGNTFTKAFRKVVKIFKETYNDPNFILVCGNRIIE